MSIRPPLFPASRDPRCSLGRRLARRGPGWLLACALGLWAAPALAHGDAWELGAVLDVAHSSREQALGAREQGLQLGHSDLSAAGPLGAWLRGRVSAGFATHGGRLEHGIEEAYAETTGLPGGLQLRGGRFASQIGRLNEQHPHADDFVERPLAYRAFLGGHWNDDGLRLNWTAPTPFYLMLGMEALHGRRLVEEAASRSGRVGVRSFTLKTGADVGREHAWQLGLSYVNNRREAAVAGLHHGHDDDDHDDHDDHDEDHGHGDHGDAGDDHAHAHHHHHGAAFSGRRSWWVDLSWKWSPGGNPREQQLRVAVDAARITGINRYAGAGEHHDALGLSVVWRWAPQWEVGARSERLRVSEPHGDHFHAARLREHAVMLAYKPSHLQALRLQWTTQRKAAGFDDAARRSVQVQYVLGFGAHPAHAF